MKFFSSPSTTQAEPVVSTATSNKENQTSPPTKYDDDTGVEKSGINNKDGGDETREDVSTEKKSSEVLDGMTSLLQERWEAFAERAINPGDDDDDDEVSVEFPLNVCPMDVDIPERIIDHPGN